MCNLIIYTDYLFQMDKKTSFNVDWLNNPAYNKWIAKDENPYKAQCRVCYTSFLLSNMGETALKSHSAGSKHKKNLTNSTCSKLSSYFSKAQPKSDLSISDISLQKPKLNGEASLTSLLQVMMC